MNASSFTMQVIKTVFDEQYLFRINVHIFSNFCLSFRLKWFHFRFASSLNLMILFYNVLSFFKFSISIRLFGSNNSLSTKSAGICYIISYAKSSYYLRCSLVIFYCLETLIKTLYFGSFLNLTIKLEVMPQFSSVQQLSHVWLLVTPWTEACQACLSTLGAYSNSCPLHHDAIQPSHPLSSPSPPTFNLSHHQGLFKSVLCIRWPSFGVSASASVLPMNIQDWFPLVLTDLISLQSKGLSRQFSNTTVQKHQFFGAQLSLKSDSHIHTWLLEKP